MIRQELEFFLDRGDSLGFQKATGTDDYLGWILLSKRKPNERLLSLLQPNEEPQFVAEQETIRRRPYQVLVQDLRRDVYESNAYETNEDFRLNQCYRFASLDEVEDFVRQFGHTLTQIKWPVEIMPR